MKGGKTKGREYEGRVNLCIFRVAFRNLSRLATKRDAKGKHCIYDGSSTFFPFPNSRLQKIIFGHSHCNYVPYFLDPLVEEEVIDNEERNTCLGFFRL